MDQHRYVHLDKDAERPGYEWATPRLLRRLVHERRIPYGKPTNPVLVDLDVWIGCWRNRESSTSVPSARAPATRWRLYERALPRRRRGYSCPCQVVVSTSRPSRRARRGSALWSPESGPAMADRDTPRASSDAIRDRMRKTSQRDTRPERALQDRLTVLGLAFEIDTSPPVASVRSRADVLFADARVAVFVDGCFWHGCPTHGTLPKANREWWQEKLASNQERDKGVERELSQHGWLVLRYWEHDDPETAAQAIALAVDERGAATK